MSDNKRKFCHFFVSDPNPESKSDPEGFERLDVLIIPDPQDCRKGFANISPSTHTERAIQSLVKEHYQRYLCTFIDKTRKKYFITKI